jgi:hypothetical protein
MMYQDYYAYYLMRFVLFLITRGYLGIINWDLIIGMDEKMTPDETDKEFREKTPQPLSDKPAHQVWAAEYGPPDGFIDRVHSE